MKVNVYTDGACSGNPGKGGYGIIMEWVGKPYVKEFLPNLKCKAFNKRNIFEMAKVIKLLKLCVSRKGINLFKSRTGLILKSSISEITGTFFSRVTRDRDSLA